ncbi:phosphoesterase family-domain-containing protein [Hysterangium stoloniferum]|nr:phosphoesterase family-domain-containing protein [Hysterangium stoloniferum]
MWSHFSSTALLLSLPIAYAAQAPAFLPPSPGPLIQSPNLGGLTNGSLQKPTVVPGKQFDRFIQIWLENTNFEVANSSAFFRNLSTQGILLEQYYGLTHPSEPNYIAVVGGDYFGMHDDALYNIPANVSTVVDLLEEKNISWASYQESMPTDGYQGFNFSSPNYLDASAPPDVFYVRKHNPLIIFDSIANIPARAALQRTFNDFAADVNGSAVPQWLFVTPNIVNDGHDTNIDFAGQWVEFWLLPLLNDTRFNDNKTLILLTFDENENAGENNRLFSILLGGAVPAKLRGTVDSTYYTHYSAISTVSANWGLGSLGRGDTNKTMSNVFSVVASATGYTNVNVSIADIPLTNSSGSTPGPLNAELYVPFTAPNASAIAAGGGKVFVAPGNDPNLTAANAPSPVNLTALGASVPASGPLNATATSPASGTPAPTSKSGAMRHGIAGALTIVGVLSAILIVL